MYDKCIKQSVGNNHLAKEYMLFITEHVICTPYGCRKWRDRQGLCKTLFICVDQLLSDSPSPNCLLLWPQCDANWDNRDHRSQSNKPANMSSEIVIIHQVLNKDLVIRGPNPLHHKIMHAVVPTSRGCWMHYILQRGGNQMAWESYAQIFLFTSQNGFFSKLCQPLAWHDAMSFKEWVFSRKGRSDTWVIGMHARPPVVTNISVLHQHHQCTSTRT